MNYPNIKLPVHVTEQEFDALRAISAIDIRSPDEQVRWLIRKEAEARGLWPLREEGDRVAA